MSKWEVFKSFYDGYESDIAESPPTEFAMQDAGWEEMFLMTPIERWLWEEIRNARMVMYPQYPVLGFFLDFANPRARVAIECDGAAYHTDKVKDRARDNKLNACGWHVYRFTGRECWQEMDFETGEASDAQKLLVEICKNHPVQRVAKSSGWVSLGLPPEQGAAA